MAGVAPFSSHCTPSFPSAAFCRCRVSAREDCVRCIDCTVRKHAPLHPFMIASALLHSSRAVARIPQSSGYCICSARPRPATASVPPAAATFLAACHLLQPRPLPLVKPAPLCTQPQPHHHLAQPVLVSICEHLVCLLQSRPSSVANCTHVRIHALSHTPARTRNTQPDTQARTHTNAGMRA